MITLVLLDNKELSPMSIYLWKCPRVSFVLLGLFPYQCWFAPRSSQSRFRNESWRSLYGKLTILAVARKAKSSNILCLRIKWLQMGFELGLKKFSDRRMTGVTARSCPGWVLLNSSATVPFCDKTHLRVCPRCLESQHSASPAWREGAAAGLVELVVLWVQCLRIYE